MKTIIYSFIAVYIFGIVAMGFTNEANTNNIILIQAVDNNVSSVSLSQSAKIISNRLKDFSSQKFILNVIPEKNQIEVILNGNWDFEYTESLLLQKGSLAFYETYNRSSLSDLLLADQDLFSLFQAGNSNESSAEIGCTSIKDVENINDYISTLELNQKCKFVWSRYSENTNVCLYALILNSENRANITGSDIESVRFHQDKSMNNNEIEIKLKESAVELWAEITKRNINKAIAIVLDNTVLSAPIVHSEITGGHATISGNYSQSEAKYIAALANNGELPISFNVVN